MNISQIREIVATIKHSGVREFEVSVGSVRVRGRFVGAKAAGASVVRQADAGGILTYGEYGPALHLSELYERGELALIRSPNVGRWRPSSMIATGARIEKDAELGAVVMFGVEMSVKSPVTGTVMTVYPGSDDPVEYGQLLCAVKREFA